MNALYEKMLFAYDQSTDQARRNAVYEVSVSSTEPKWI